MSDSQEDEPTVLTPSSNIAPAIGNPTIEQTNSEISLPPQDIPIEKDYGNIEEELDEDLRGLYEKSIGIATELKKALEGKIADPTTTPGEKTKAEEMLEIVNAQIDMYNAELGFDQEGGAESESDESQSESDESESDESESDEEIEQQGGNAETELNNMNLSPELLANIKRLIGGGVSPPILPPRPITPPKPSGGKSIKANRNRNRRVTYRVRRK